MGEKKHDRVSHCEILGVTERATKAEIKYAFFRAAEAYQYLIENESPDPELDPNPPLLKFESFSGVNLVTPPRSKRHLLPLAITLAILAALIPQYREDSGQAEALKSPRKMEALRATAESFFQNKQFADCIYEVSLLRNYDRDAAKTTDDLYDNCIRGTVNDALDIREGLRAPASLATQSIDFDLSRISDDQFIRSVCSGQLFRRFERIYASPELPEVKVIFSATPEIKRVNMGIAALSGQLRAQFHRATEPAGQVGRDLQAFCAAQPRHL
jgi:hypothetical protein